MKPTVYIETSVISYLTSRPNRDLIVAAHQQITQEWWKQLHLFEPFISEVVYNEISCGDSNAAEKRINAVRNFDYLTINPDVLELAKEYYDAINLSEKAQLDSVHLALAVHHGIDYLVSWNLIHISGARPRKIVEQVNYSNGIRTPIICTPEELLED